MRELFHEKYICPLQIELFFKWIKQNLKIKRFLGRSENAVKIQILTAMIAYLLLRFAQLSYPCKLSLQQIARKVSLNLMTRCQLISLFSPPPIKMSGKKAGLQCALAL